MVAERLRYLGRLGFIVGPAASLLLLRVLSDDFQTVNLRGLMLVVKQQLEVDFGSSKSITHLPD
jgi:hypothetical protein